MKLHKVSTIRCCSVLSVFYPTVVKPCGDKGYALEPTQPTGLNTCITEHITVSLPLLKALNQQGKMGSLKNTSVTGGVQTQAGPSTTPNGLTMCQELGQIKVQTISSLR